MTDAELLKRVKSSLGITGTYQDETLSNHINEAKYYLNDAGVPIQIINSEASVGVIVRGVSDLWNYGMGDGKLSEYFMQRATQLRYKDVPEQLGELTIDSTPGSEIGTTHISVQGSSTDANYRYQFNVILPNYNENLSDWISWDGVSDIVAEDGHQICVAEITSDNLALAAGITTIVANLG